MKLGTSLSQQTVYKGFRMSSAASVLNKEGDIGPGLIRLPNLEVRTESRVNKILFDDDRVAKGVVLQGGQRCAPTHTFL